MPTHLTNSTGGHKPPVQPPPPTAGDLDDGGLDYRGDDLNVALLARLRLWIFCGWLTPEAPA